MLGVLRALRNCWSSSDGIVVANLRESGELRGRCDLGEAEAAEGKLREALRAKTLEVHRKKLPTVAQRQEATTSVHETLR